MNFRTVTVFLLAATFIARAAWADTAAIEGIVKDANGKALKGADIRIEATGGSHLFKVAKSDANGHYAYVGLTPGTYRVSLVVNGATKASVNNTALKSGGSTTLNFDLAKGTAPATASSGKKKTHHIYVPGTTGSHMGGRWVEVEEGDNTTTQSNVRRVNAGALMQLQSGSGGAGSGN